MDTPICDFVRKYASSETVRMHMPGHKGKSVLGMEQLDITEINGADSLYEADGIIAKSEANASEIFGCRTLYSTEGSSQCIRAMLYLVSLYAKNNGRAPLILAARNAHKTFLTAAGLLDVDVEWLYPENTASYLSCNVTAEELDKCLKNMPQKPVAVYLTSPDYLGLIADISGVAETCHRHGVLLAVDNAHGAYLKFLPKSLHPIDLGADICCDSAHKTLSVLTGGAYLHLSDSMNKAVGVQAKNALMLFGSTSPSYLILQSLDRINPYLVDYPVLIKDNLDKIEALKNTLKQHGYKLYGNEPFKVTICAKEYGYSGNELADLLRSAKIEPEFTDPDFLVLMFSDKTDAEDFDAVEKILYQIPDRSPIIKDIPSFSRGKKLMSIREAMLSDSEVIPSEKCLGRILAVPTVGCPPAVPILVCGEQIDDHAISLFDYYAIDNCCVVKE